MSLRIPLTVERCAGADRAGRVRYRYRDRCLIPEDIVLRRWQDRTNEPAQRGKRTRFEGCRLPSGTWTLLLAWTRDGLPVESLTDAKALNECAARNRAAGGKLRTPVPSKFAHLLGYLLSRGVLDDVIRRERSVEHPGLPDLFLYRLDSRGRVHGGMFVEVKRSNPHARTREKVSPAQRDEIAFLKRLGLRAQVVYLVERAPRARKER
jgi:VRR-NUC domain